MPRIKTGGLFYKSIIFWIITFFWLGEGSLIGCGGCFRRVDLIWKRPKINFVPFFSFFLRFWWPPIWIRTARKGIRCLRKTEKVFEIPNKLGWRLWRSNKYNKENISRQTATNTGLQQVLWKERRDREKERKYYV